MFSRIVWAAAGNASRTWPSVRVVRFSNARHFLTRAAVPYIRDKIYRWWSTILFAIFQWINSGSDQSKSKSIRISDRSWMELSFYIFRLIYSRLKIRFSRNNRIIRKFWKFYVLTFSHFLETSWSTLFFSIFQWKKLELRSIQIEIYSDLWSILDRVVFFPH